MGAVTKPVARGVFRRRKERVAGGANGALGRVPWAIASRVGPLLNVSLFCRVDRAHPDLEDGADHTPGA